MHYHPKLVSLYRVISSSWQHDGWSSVHDVFQNTPPGGLWLIGTSEVCLLMFSIFLMMIPLATAVFEAGGGPGLRQVAAPSERAVQRRLLAKAAGMRDGPRPGQTGLLLLLWLTAGSLALLQGLASPPSPQSTYGTVETFIQP